MIGVNPVDLDKNPGRTAITQDGTRVWCTDDDGYWAELEGHPVSVCSSFMFSLDWPAEWSTE